MVTCGASLRRVFPCVLAVGSRLLTRQVVKAEEDLHNRCQRDSDQLDLVSRQLICNKCSNST